MGLLFDVGPIAAIQGFFGPGWEPAFRILSLLGTTWGILLVLSLALWLWGREALYAVLGLVLLEAALKLALNWLVQVDRPQSPRVVRYEVIEGVSSFPSGHQSTLTALWSYLALARGVPWLLVGVLVVSQAVSRLYLGTHYVVDIVAAVALGLLLAWAWARLWPRARAWLAPLPFAFYATVAAASLAGTIAYAATGAGDSVLNWQAVGLLAALAIALPLEGGWVRYSPGPGARGRKLLLGLAGIVPAAVVEQLGGGSLWLAATTVFLATLWALLVVPTLFAWLGWSAHAEPETRRRAAAIGRALLVGVALVVALAGYGSALEPRLILDVREEAAAVPALPPAWAGARLAVLGDFQLGLWWDNQAMAERAVAEAASREVDAVLLLGDFLYSPAGRERELIGRAIGVVRPLVRSGIPTFAVLGNHDWGLKARDGEPLPEAAAALEDSLRAAGVRVLRNESVALKREGEPLFFAGVGSRWAGEADPFAALADVPANAPRVVFMHHPDSFGRLPAGSAPLALAGHTHGGQLRIPFLPEWSWLSFAAEDEVHADGWVEGFGAAGNRLYVNRGIGMSVLPVRVNCPPELTILTLTPGGEGR